MTARQRKRTSVLATAFLGGAFRVARIGAGCALQFCGDCWRHDIDETLNNDELAAHHAQIGLRWEEALEGAGYDAGIVLSGNSSLFFQDDQGPHFVANPYLVQWVGQEGALEGSALLVRPNARPALLLYRPEDYWHAPGVVPEHIKETVDLEVFTSGAQLFAALEKLVAGARTAVVGPADAGSNETLGDLNPAAVLAPLAFGRAVKTPHELERMRAASRVGARGHVAAERAFHQGGSEFEIHLRYLGASNQNEHGTPYPNIIAQNEHAALLHYQHQERLAPAPLRSLLIDAGGNCDGYASDITRTHVSEQDDAGFGELIASMQTHQDELLAMIRPGINYLDLHKQMHEQLCAVLVDNELLHCSAAEAFAKGYSEAFCPHGLGHLLGLQVHDVGGQQTAPDGTQTAPPDNYPSLRLTRDLVENQVFTIEPGLYFIPSLLDDLERSSAPVNWQRVDALRPYGGIRIEDNVRVTATGIENLTRDAFAAIADE